MQQVIDLNTITLKKGSHLTREYGMCIMEAAAFLAGEEHSAYPLCTPPSIGAFLRTWQDELTDEERNRLLKPYLLKIIGLSRAPALELKRVYLALDWFVREYAPAWLDFTPALQSHAAALRALKPLVDESSVQAAQPALDVARDAAMDAARSAARDPARDAARDATWRAAGSAAGSATGNAARDAAMDAARSAARSAAWNAAGSAAGSALQPTVEKLQQSALGLLDRMIAAKE